LIAHRQPSLFNPRVRSRTAVLIYLIDS
jgi:hypothetical protein